MAHGCGGGGTSRQVTCVLVLPPKSARRQTSHALCSFNSFLQPRWFAEVIGTTSSILQNTHEIPYTHCDAAQGIRLE